MIDREFNALRPVENWPSFQYAVYDVETFGIDDDRLQMIGVYHEGFTRTFRDIGEFLRWIITPQFQDYRFFAHYGGKFDVHYIFDWLKERNFCGMEIEFFCSGSCVVSFTIFKGKDDSRAQWRFADSYRLLEASLKKLTNEFDVAHKKLDFAPAEFNYNRHDCIGLYEVLTKFFAVYSITSETVASHALRVYRSRYLPRWIFQPPPEVEN